MRLVGIVLFLENRHKAGSFGLKQVQYPYKLVVDDKGNHG